MTYKATLEWMFQRLPMYQDRGASAYTGKLDHIRELCNHLGNPHNRFKSVHVAGTNGKGSSCHMLASVLHEAGYRVGLYTSPHLKDFRERIRINGIPVSKNFVTDFIKQHKAFLESGQYSFFELSVVMAFQHFAEQEVDIAIIEVGLGGRLDSTNIITPEVSLITNIGMDHMDILGDTLEKITREKAGIIKPGIPVVISEYHEETAPVFIEVAQRNGIKPIFADEVIEEAYPTSLLGKYQVQNVRGVMATLRQLSDFEITEEQLRDGLLHVYKNTGILGRYQVLQRNPLVIADTAHNREGFKAVLPQLEQEKKEQLHMVLGFVKDKNLDYVFPLFPKTARYYFARPDIRRGLEVEELMGTVEKYGLSGQAYPSVKDALDAALSAASPYDLIYVGGSTFTVAEVV